MNKRESQLEWIVNSRTTDLFKFSNFQMQGTFISTMLSSKQHIKISDQIICWKDVANEIESVCNPQQLVECRCIIHTKTKMSISERRRRSVYVGYGLFRPNGGQSCVIVFHAIINIVVGIRCMQWAHRTHYYYYLRCGEWRSKDFSGF